MANFQSVNYGLISEAMRRSAEDAWKTKESILTASLGVFEDHGWRGATFEVIARAAGVSRGALNHHFASKLELLSHALEYGWAQFGDRLFMKDIAATSAHQNIRVLLQHYMLWLRDDPQFRALVSTTVIVAPQAFGQDSRQKNDALDTWKHQIGTYLGAGSGLPAPKDMVARNIMVFLQGLAVTAITTPGELPTEAELAATVDYLVRGFLGAPLATNDEL